MTENSEPENLQTDLVYALACTPDMGVCFAARGSGLYRSEDGGEIWQSAYDSLDFTGPMPTTSIVLSPDITIDAAVFAGVPGGIWRSTDAGVNWLPTSLASPPPLVSTMAISPNYIEDGVVLLGTAEDGVFRSADRGSYWSRWNFGLLDLTAYCIGVSPDYAADETLYVGVESGIFRSTNGGRAWREVDLPVGFDPVLSMALSPGFTVDGVIFAGTETKGLLYSSDKGQTWKQIGTGFIELSVNSILLSPEYPQQPDVLVLHEDGLLLSRDSGESWAQVPTNWEDITAVVAPQGLYQGALLLIGLLDGSVHRMSL